MPMSKSTILVTCMLIIANTSCARTEHGITTRQAVRVLPLGTEVLPARDYGNLITFERVSDDGQSGYFKLRDKETKSQVCSGWVKVGQTFAGIARPLTGEHGATLLSIDSRGARVEFLWAQSF